MRTQEDDPAPVDLTYASREDAVHAHLPHDSGVLLGLRVILAGIVLLPCVAGLIMIVMMLVGGTDGWADLFRDWLK